jgi:site-specific DNA-methyltransferase (adenine-specific)|tara:strand:+ start:646 stop:1428 length:783 start_codon:yes stop_codon:yes gene_type:complete
MSINLMHGDCLELMKTIPDGSVDMVLTDPPYGTTQCKWDSIIPLVPMWDQLKRIIKPNGAIVLMTQTPFDKVLGASNLPMLKYEWIWEKTAATGHLNAKKMPMKAHENVLVFYSKLPLYNAQKTQGHKAANLNKSISNDDCDVYGETKIGIQKGGNTSRYPRSVQVFSSDKQKSNLHPTQKPVALMEYLIKTYTNEGETVLDFTMGSGTTGVACKILNRDFIGIELDENYFKISKDRIGNTCIEDDNDFNPLPSFIEIGE